MVEPFVAASVKRFVALACRDCEEDEAEALLFGLVDDVRREARDKGERLNPLVRALETLAREAEIRPRPGGPREEDDAAPLRFAGILRRAADLLRGPEKDLTPRSLSGEKARPRH